MLFAFPVALFPFLAERFHDTFALGLLYAGLPIGAFLASVTSRWTARIDSPRSGDRAFGDRIGRLAVAGVRGRPTACLLATARASERRPARPTHAVGSSARRCGTHRSLMSCADAWRDSSCSATRRAPNSARFAAPSWRPGDHHFVFRLSPGGSHLLVVLRGARCGCSPTMCPRVHALTDPNVAWSEPREKSSIGVGRRKKRE